jgi:predicted DNA-binding antitoxin AbrB/MazE fold protein
MTAKPAATIKARFKNGVIEPLENLELKDGEEITKAVQFVFDLLTLG